VLTLLPYVGTPKPPLTSAANTPFWNEGTGAALVNTWAASGSQVLPISCPRTNHVFFHTNRTKMSANDVAEAAKKVEDTVILRRLANPYTINYFFTGKGYDSQSLTYIIKYYRNRMTTLQTNALDGRSRGSRWDQLSSDVALFNSVSMAPVLSSDKLFQRFLMNGFMMNPGNEWQLHEDSIRITDLAPSYLSFVTSSTCTSSSDLQAEKTRFASLLQFVENSHVLLRHPGVFSDAFNPIITVLQDTQHEVNKDVYTVVSLVWFLELSLARFYRCIQFAEGPGSVLWYRRLLYDHVVAPFVGIQPEMMVQYSLHTQQTPKVRIPTKQGASNDKPGGPIPTGVCRFLFAHFLSATSPTSPPTVRVASMWHW
jgi:hypothetical protein